MLSPKWQCASFGLLVLVTASCVPDTPPPVAPKPDVAAIARERYRRSESAYKKGVELLAEWTAKRESEGLADRGLINDAVVQFKEAVHADPSNALIWFKLAEVQEDCARAFDDPVCFRMAYNTFAQAARVPSGAWLDAPAEANCNGQWPVRLKTCALKRARELESKTARVRLVREPDARPEQQMFGTSPAKWRVEIDGTSVGNTEIADVIFDTPLAINPGEHHQLSVADGNKHFKPTTTPFSAQIGKETVVTIKPFKLLPQPRDVYASFVAADAGVGRWTLHRTGGRQVCRLPCSLWYPADDLDAYLRYDTGVYEESLTEDLFGSTHRFSTGFHVQITAKPPFSPMPLLIAGAVVSAGLGASGTYLASRDCHAEEPNGRWCGPGVAGAVVGSLGLVAAFYYYVQAFETKSLRPTLRIESKVIRDVSSRPMNLWPAYRFLGLRRRFPATTEGAPGSVPMLTRAGRANARRRPAEPRLEYLTAYHQIVGWGRLGEIDMGPMGKYVLWGRGDRQLGGMMTMTPGMKSPDGRDVPPSWMYYITTDDLDAALARAKARGARVLTEPMEVPGGQRIVNLLDPQGAAFSLVSAPTSSA
jgi:predicted enzyme related to lactoylglutathione lyase